MAILESIRCELCHKIFPLIEMVKYDKYCSDCDHKNRCSNEKIMKCYTFYKEAMWYFYCTNCRLKYNLI